MSSSSMLTSNLIIININSFSLETNTALRDGLLVFFFLVVPLIVLAVFVFIKRDQLRKSYCRRKRSQTNKYLDYFSFKFLLSNLIMYDDNHIIEDSLKLGFWFISLFFWHDEQELKGKWWLSHLLQWWGKRVMMTPTCILLEMAPRLHFTWLWFLIVG